MINEEKLLTDIFVGVVAGLTISFITWLLQGTIHLVAKHPWLILISGVVVAVITVLGIFYYRYVSEPIVSSPVETFEDNLSGEDEKDYI